MFGIKEIGSSAGVKMLAAQAGVEDVTGKQLARAEVPGALEAFTAAAAGAGSEVHTIGATFRGRPVRVLIVLEPAPAS